jgi:UDPglucose 6-dehydrogenase
MSLVQRRRTRLIACSNFNMKIIIVGYGFVGKAVANALKNKHEIIVVDPKHTTEQIKDHPDADGVIVCVPTPTTENGICDASILATVMDQVPIFLPVLIKSTVTPAIVEGFETVYSEHSICYSPEFLRARSADKDFLNQKYVVIGGEDPEYFWQELFQTSLPNCQLVLNCTAKEASLIKYATNSFLALKTSYFNQINDICNSTGMDFDIVRHILSQDQRIGSDHTMVPGPDGERGWGGHCFPKDTTAFIQWSNTIGSPITLVEETVKYNHQIRKNT